MANLRLCVILCVREFREVCLETKWHKKRDPAIACFHSCLRSQDIEVHATVCRGSHLQLARLAAHIPEKVAERYLVQKEIQTNVQYQLDSDSRSGVSKVYTIAEAF
jgi:hypothetical protein